MADLVYRPATPEDIREYFGERQRMTLKAYVVTLDEVPVGIIGLARQGVVVRFFSEFRPELRPHLKSMACLRAIKASMELVKRCLVPVYALAQCDEEASHAILQRLGFVQDQLNPEVYSWPS